MVTSYPKVPVLVVGGGSVGLLTAALLAHHGLRPTLVERRDGPSVHPRATGIGSRSVEILRELGLDGRVDAASVALTGGKATARTLVELRREPVDPTVASAVPPDDELAVAPFRLRGVCAQDRLDAVVAGELDRRGVDVRWSTRLVSFVQDDDGVAAELEGATGRYRLRCARLVAADGAHSAVRDALGIGMSGPGHLSGLKMSILFRADLRRHLAGATFATCTITTPQAPGLLVTVDGARDWVFHVGCDVEAGERPEDFSPRRCAELVRAAAGDPDLDVEVRDVLPWRSRALRADRFVDGRVFLVGDAAHPLSSLGAFGLNTGIADAHNLAWKLAAVHRGTAGEALLGTYAREREPVAAATLDQAVRRLADFRLHWGRGPAADAARAAAGVWAAPVVHYGMPYASAAVVGTRPGSSVTELGALLDGAPGTRVPHAWVDTVGGRVSTLDLVATRWTLLTGPAASSWDSAAAEVGIPAHRVDVPLPGLAADGALLVRPDAVVAWQAGPPTERPAARLAEVVDRVRCRDRTPA